MTALLFWYTHTHTHLYTFLQSLLSSVIHIDIIYFWCIQIKMFSSFPQFLLFNYVVFFPRVIFINKFPILFPSVQRIYFRWLWFFNFVKIWLTYRICLGEWSRDILKGCTLVRWMLIMPVGPSCCSCCPFLFFNVNIQSNLLWHLHISVLSFVLYRLLLILCLLFLSYSFS